MQHRTDDNRGVAQACGDVRVQADAAVRSLEEAYRVVAAAHEITSHLIFEIADDGPGPHSGHRDPA